MKKIVAAALALLLAAAAHAQSPSSRLRGTVKSFDGTTLVVTGRSGETVSLVLASDFGVNEVVPTATRAFAGRDGFTPPM